jgi:hypothetical protein
MNRRKWLYAAATLAVAGILAVSRHPVETAGKRSPESAASAASDKGDAWQAYLLQVNEIILGLPLSFLSPPGAPGPTWENYFRIENGMTRAELEAILGGPPDCEIPLNTDMATYLRRQTATGNAKPIDFPQLARWEIHPQDDHWPQIAVTFDPSGRVCDKRLAEIDSPFTTKSTFNYSQPGRLDVMLRQLIQWLRAVYHLPEFLPYSRATSRRSSDDR